LYGFETWSLKLREEYRLKVFGNMVLSSIFGPKREEVAGGWRASPNIIRVIKPRRMRGTGTGYVARIGEKRNVYKIWLENLKGRDHSEEVGENGRIILK
jgi:hypothetical protein